MTALLLAALLVGQPDSIIVSVELTETQRRVLVTAVLEADSTLRLPAAPIAELLDVSFPSPWIALASLRQAWPTVRFVWIPRELRLVILDDGRVFPASRKANQQVLVQNQMTLGLPGISGPYAALSFDDRSALFGMGYSWRGRIGFGGLLDNEYGALWHATIAPSSHLTVSHQGGVGIPPTLQGRIAAGPLWLAAAATPHRPVDLAGSLHVGLAQVFANPDFGVLTLQPAPHVAVQVAQTWYTKRSAVRISVGPTYASPFSFPVTSLHPRR